MHCRGTRIKPLLTHPCFEETNHLEIVNWEGWDGIPYATAVLTKSYVGYGLRLYCGVDVERRLSKASYYLFIGLSVTLLAGHKMFTHSIIAGISKKLKTISRKLLAPELLTQVACCSTAARWHRSLAFWYCAQYVVLVLFRLDVFFVHVACFVTNGEEFQGNGLCCEKISILIIVKSG